MPESDGFRALGFVFPSVLRKWDGVIREVAFDSTCKSIYLFIVICIYLFIFQSKRTKLASNVLRFLAKSVARAFPLVLSFSNPTNRTSMRKRNTCEPRFVSSPLSGVFAPNRYYQTKTSWKLTPSSRSSPMISSIKTPLCPRPPSCPLQCRRGFQRV
jgi:hypothetical protein